MSKMKELAEEMKWRDCYLCGKDDLEVNMYEWDVNDHQVELVCGVCLDKERGENGKNKNHKSGR